MMTMKAATILILKLTLILVTAFLCVLSGYYHGRNKFYKEGLEHGAAQCANKNGHPEREH